MSLKGTTALWYLPNTSVTSITNPAGGPGVDGAITLTGVVFNFQKMDGKHTADKAVLKNGQGRIKGAAYTGFMKEATVTIIPSGASLTIMKQANVTIDPGGILVLADTDDAQAANNWIIDEVSWTRTNDGAKALDFKVWNAADSDISADASTA